MLIDQKGNWSVMLRGFPIIILNPIYIMFLCFDGYDVITKFRDNVPEVTKTPD